MRIFAQITKVDEAKHEVWGRAVQEVPDNAAEIFDYETSKPFFKAWSEEFQKATDGKSMGNIRAMHGNVAAGKAIAIDFNDVEKAIDIGTKIVDGNEWNKVMEGVYTGFSIGGKYEKKWSDGELARYTANPNEISLVDKPCVPTAKFFEVIKMDGQSEQRSFKPGDKVDLAKAGEVLATDEIAQMLTKGEISASELLALAKAKKDGPKEGAGDEKEPTPEDGKDKKDEERATPKVKDKGKKIPESSNEDGSPEGPGEGKEKTPPKGDKDGEDTVKRDFSQKERDKAAESGAAMPDGSFPIKSTADLDNAVSDYGRAKDKAKAKAHIIARAKALGATDQLPEDWEGSTKTKSKKADSPKLKKGMYDVARLAGMVQDLNYLRMCAADEASWEGDASEVPGKLKEAVDSLGEILRDMVDEELEELTADPKAVVTPLAMADQGGKLVKAGARHSKTDLEHLQSAHDHLVKMGAACMKSNGTQGANERAMPDAGGHDAAMNEVVGDPIKGKSDSGEMLKTALSSLKKVEEMETLLKAANATITDLSARLKKVEDQPMPAKGATMNVPVTKAADAAVALGEAQNVEPVRKSDGSVDDVATAIKKAQQSPIQMIRY